MKLYHKDKNKAFKKNIKSLMEKQVDLPVINFEKYGQLTYSSIEKGLGKEQQSQNTRFLGIANQATKQEDVRELEINIDPEENKEDLDYISNL